METNLNQIILVKDINPITIDSYYYYGYSYTRSSDPDSLTEFNGKLYFAADDGESGKELFVSDGTEEGTKLVKDLFPGISESQYSKNSSYPSDFIEFKDKLYFTANDSENGRELFVSDGTAEGTELVADIYPGNNYGNSYRYDPGNFIEFKDKLYFTANNGESGRELFVSDGTAEGTELVADINPEKDSRGNGISSYISGFTEFNDQLYFTADNGESGQELWVSDGTTEGTRLLVDINPDKSKFSGNGLSSYIYGFIEFNDQLYFTANDSENGQELWVSDGTTEGTRLLVDINPGNDASGYEFSSNPSSFIEFNDQLYFTANNGENGQELFVTDGTAEGTQLVADIHPGNNNYGYGYGSIPSSFIEFNDQLYFTADDGENGQELWVSDGTTEGTQLKINLDLLDLNQPYFIEFNDQLYFSATGDRETGREPWVTDGTTEGTQLIEDLFRPGINSYETGSYPTDFTLVGDELFFSARNAESGRELFKLTADRTLISGTNGSDNLVGSDSSEEIQALSGKDTVDSAGGNDTIDGGDGDDRLTSNAGNNSFLGGNGNDRIRSGAGNDTIDGGNGDDRLTSTGGDNIFDGGNGKDIILGGNGKDVSTGKSGDDTLIGGIGDDFLDGGNNKDILLGEDGEDSLIGGAGDDILIGEGGDDILDGNAGFDILTGGDGADVFVIRLGAETDIVVDFDSASDRLGLADGLQFNDLSFSGQTILSGEEVLASLNGISTDQLTSRSFIEV
jgi:ELWxxDGT repeat protein